MKKIFNFFASLKFIFMPHYWIMEDGYDEAWDRKFCELAETHDFIPDFDYPIKAFGNKAYCAFIGEYRVWTSNFPFAFFCYCGKKTEKFDRTGVRPSRRTIAKYYKKLVQDMAKHNCKHR